MVVAETTLATPRNDELLRVFGQIGQHITGFIVAHHGTHRHLDYTVLPAFSGFELSAARLAVLGPVKLLVS